MRRGPLGTKHLLRKILYSYVPRELIERPKQGFAIPLAAWLRGELAPLIDEYLSPARIKDGGLFDPARSGAPSRTSATAGRANDRLDVQKVWLLARLRDVARAAGGNQAHGSGRSVAHARAVHH